MADIADTTAIAMAPTEEPTRVEMAVSNLDAWFETMRSPQGYGGPVAHWWQQCFVYTGVGLDWRYEGITAGYIDLWKRTGNSRWLAKARRAGDDLLAGQLENGHFAASQFEMNPATAGTPHEAACDVALLLLSLALRAANAYGYEQYAACAERNLRSFYIEQLWDVQAKSFRDSPEVPSFVPNKAATACEAFFLMAEFSGEDQWVERYGLPNLDRILDHQVHNSGRLHGAIAQNSFGSKRVEKYFPVYIARCIPALLRGYNWTADERYIQAALDAAKFIVRWGNKDGSFPTVVYGNEKVNSYPSWIAPLADILRACRDLAQHGLDADLESTFAKLLCGQDTSGGIQTARGFSAQPGGKPGHLPDVRDVLHVVGWCDKAFRYLTSCVSTVPTASSRLFQAECTFRGQCMMLTESEQHLKISVKGDVRYLWTKGEPWPRIASKEFWLR